MAEAQKNPRPKPSDVKSPVPNKAAFDELDAFEADFAKLDAMESARPAETPGIAQEAATEVNGGGGIMSGAANALDTAGRILDYPAGFVRTGLANIAGMAQDVAQGKNPLEEPPIVTTQDLKEMLKGNAPGFAEYMKRMGVGEGGSLGGISMRGAAGFLGDVLTDPFSVVAKTAKQIPYIAKLINHVPEGLAALSPNKAVEALGESVYKSTVAATEQRLAKKGVRNAKVVGEALVEGIPEAGIKGAPIGGSDMLRQRVEDIAGAMGKIRQSLYDRASELGVTIDTAYPLKRAEGVLKDMQRFPGTRALADDLANLLGEYKGQGKVSIDTVSDWKTQLYNSLPKSAWTGPKLNSWAKQFKAALARDFKETIEQAGNKAEKGLGDAIQQLNAKWGTLLDAPKYMGNAGAGTLGHRIDSAAVALGAVTGGPVGAAKAAAVNKAYKVATGATARTAVGRALMEAGRKDVANRLVRQTIAGATGEAQ